MSGDPSGATPGNGARPDPHHRGKPAGTQPEQADRTGGVAFRAVVEMRMNDDI